MILLRLDVDIGRFNLYGLAERTGDDLDDRRLFSSGIPFVERHHAVRAAAGLEVQRLHDGFQTRPIWRVLPQDILPIPPGKDVYAEVQPFATGDELQRLL